MHRAFPRTAVRGYIRISRALRCAAASASPAHCGARLQSLSRSPALGQHLFEKRDGSRIIRLAQPEHG